MSHETSPQSPGQVLFHTLPPGTAIGHSEWIRVTQAMIDQFGAATLDPDPMHVDPDWARTQGPFPHTIAFGFLTVSLLTRLIHSATHTGSVHDPGRTGYYLNYGFDRLRLVAPVPVDSRIRGHFRVLETRRDEAGRQVTKFGCEIEIENGTRPALIAEWLSIWVPPA